ncbi:hypothetical protein [Mycolicibacterium vaccae]|uniref:hypothetical protein n=1 Tax=Mycolicibacterium vaccae TaxID=1810 RepID=UPI003D00D80B
MAVITTITGPSKTDVICPLCDEKIECTVHFDITAPDGSRGTVMNIEPIFTPDLVEQFTPHLRQAHPLEYARMTTR